jgi:DNA-directed RNA polymerase alpha subunit
MQSDRKISHAEIALVDQCVERLRRALLAGNCELAHRTIDWHEKNVAELDQGTPLELAKISPRVCEILDKLGITSVEQLCEVTYHQLAQIYQVGPLQIAEIKQRLRAIGRCLKKPF